MDNNNQIPQPPSGGVQNTVPEPPVAQPVTQNVQPVQNAQPAQQVVDEQPQQAQPQTNPNNSVEQIYQREDIKQHKSNKRGILLLILIIILSVVAYYRVKDYKKSKEIATSPLIYDVLEDNNNYYDEKTNVSYVFVIIRNYKEDEVNNSKLKYSFTVSNKENSNGIFKVINMNTNEETEYMSEVTITGEMKPNEKEDVRYKVFIDSEKNENQAISYEIKYNFSRE